MRSDTTYDQTYRARALPLITADPSGTEGREQALYGAYLSAVAFASAGSGLHHKICHVLGGTFNLPHAQTHATVLPYVLALNAPAAPHAAERIAAAFGTTGSGAPDALAGPQELRTRLDAPKALADYGFAAEGIAEAVAILLPAVPASNPRPATTENSPASSRQPSPAKTPGPSWTSEPVTAPLTDPAVVANSPHETAGGHHV